MTTVHMIGNAHIDPVWLWRWTEGIVESLSTCRSAAHLLDRYPDFVFTRADAWVHEQIERYDPALFGRIARHVEAGRWVPVGGWYVQPDCNFPSSESFRRQISIGKRYFSDRFGIDINTGFNVDSFGHAATLPSLLAEAGYTGYVMMRPGPHEMELPGHLFKWRGPDGREVLTWRIPKSYNAQTPEKLEENIRAATEAADEKIGHVMCFYGVGDHGGGPTAELIEWIEKNRESFTDARLEFSHPARFFEAVSTAGTDSLPVVEGELQKHAIGCYSVVADMKRDVRRAETSLLRAENMRRVFGNAAGVNSDTAEGRPTVADSAVGAQNTAADSDSDVSSRIEEAWKLLLFNEFHDTLGGSSIRDAYIDARDQLGTVVNIADSATTDTCMRNLVSIEPDPLQRIVLYNSDPYDYTGPLHHEPWIHDSDVEGRLLDENGTEVTYQVVQHRAFLGEKRGIVWIDTIKGESRRILRYDPKNSPGRAESDIEAVFEADSATNVPSAALKNDAWEIRPGKGTELAVLNRQIAESDVFRIVPRITIREDSSDTWSHGIDAYSEKAVGDIEITGYEIEESGPIRGVLRVDGELGETRMSLWFRLYRGSPELELTLAITWSERFRISKLVLSFPEPFTERTDGIPGGGLQRRQDGTEYPVQNWFIGGSGENRIGVGCPDVFALDGSGNEVRCTLLRSPVYAWHKPTILSESGSYMHTDQGTHTFRFLIVPDAEPVGLDRLAKRLAQPPLGFDWTGGMEEIL